MHDGAVRASAADCVEAAEAMGAALIRAPDFLVVAKRLLETPDARLAEACRKAIFAGDGVFVDFLEPLSAHPSHGEGRDHSHRSSAL